MWHALRAELAYFRSYLFGGFTIAVGVVVIVSLVFYAVGEAGPPPHAAAGIRGMFLIMAPLILGFVIQAMRTEERRTRLLLAGPLTPRQLAAVNVLLPLVLLAIGVLAGGLMIGVEALIRGRLEVEALQIVTYVGGMIFMGLMIGSLVQEAIAAYQQGRKGAAVAGWAAFAAAVLVMGALIAAAVVYQGPMSWPGLHLGNVVGSVLMMLASVALYGGRTDFTR